MVMVCRFYDGGWTIIFSSLYNTVGGNLLRDTNKIIQTSVPNQILSQDEARQRRAPEGPTITTPIGSEYVRSDIEKKFGVKNFIILC